MTRIAIWLASTITIVVLLFGYHTSTDSTATAPAVSSLASAPTTAVRPTAPTTAIRPTAPTTSTAPTTPTAPTAPTSGGSRPPTTYPGAVAQTRWGPLQVQITVTGGKITDVQIPQYPDGNSRDAEINAYALPTLIQETKQQQSAAIDMVSGATVTSDGYLRSLQSALDAAGL